MKKLILALLLALTAISAHAQLAPGSGSGTITSGATPTSGFTTNHLMGVNSSKAAVDSGVVQSGGVIAAASGGAGTVTGALKGNGSGTVSQAACSDLSGVGSGCSATVPTGAWTSFTPAITCGSGAVGAYGQQVGSYQQIGKATFIDIDVQAAIGTCTGTVSINIPVAAPAGFRQVLAGVDFTTSLPLAAQIASSGSSVTVQTSAGSNPTGSDRLTMTGVYQSQ